MIAYKGFSPGLVCRGYQFKMGLNVTPEANCVHNGFHCAANPLDCLTYYSDFAQNEYYIVNAGGDIDEDDRDSKIACTELTILKRLDLKDFVLHALVYLHDHPLMPWNQHVKCDAGEANSGFVIVRGIDPKAAGKDGDVLALARESADGSKVEQIALTVVDGVHTHAGTWYNIDLRPCTVFSPVGKECAEGSKGGVAV